MAISAVVAVAIAACGGSPGATSPAVAKTEGVAPVQVITRVPLDAVEPMPAPSWDMSFDIWLARGSRLQIRAGYGREPLNVSGLGAKLLVTVDGVAVRALTEPPGWLGGGWWHFEATNTRLAIDGWAVPVRPTSATTIAFRAEAGRPLVRALIGTAAVDRDLLLLHRVAELHARIPVGQFPVGATRSDRIMYGTTYWTNGFWAGALWQAAAIAPHGGLFARWALTETLAHFGQEHAATHDVGFMYGQSSLAAWLALCQYRSAPRRVATDPVLCARLERSVLSAADELRVLAASNPGASTIPTDETGPVGDTIVDSMMNIAILPWATRVTGNPAYAQLASHQAQVIARLLVRRDGSTAQAVNFDRQTGRVLSIGTHQGLSDGSTWSRGEGWALYGFAQAAGAFHDRGMLRVALQVARFVASRLPPGGIPRWDYDAPVGAPVDVSAGVITAAGLLHLASACRALPGVCSRGPGQWTALGRRMLSASLVRANAQPPLGLLGSQVLNERGHGCWCDGGELSFGLAYGLEGVRLVSKPSRSGP